MILITISLLRFFMVYVRWTTRGWPLLYQTVEMVVNLNLVELDREPKLHVILLVPNTSTKQDRGFLFFTEMWDPLLHSTKFDGDNGGGSNE